MINSEGNKNLQLEASVLHSPVRSVFDKFSKHRDISLVYGDPIEHGKRKIIPVAKINYSIAGGGGGGMNAEGKVVGKTVGKGEGAAGHINVKPVGVYEITDKKVRFKPLYGLKLPTIVLSILTLGIAIIFRKK